MPSSAVSTVRVKSAGVADPSQVPAKLRVTELDLLRFCAAFAVMLYHYTYKPTLPNGPPGPFPILGRLTMHGYLGVSLFFMISGFVILWTAREKTPSGFVISRISRLYPEFWIGVALSSLTFATLGPSTRSIGLGTMLANLTMVPHFLGYPYVDDVYWTLFVELKFYFLLWALSVTGQMSRIESWLYAWLGVTVLCFVFDMPAAVRSMALYPYGPLFIGGCSFFLIRARGSTAARWIAVPVCLVLAVQATTNMMPAFVHREDVTRDALNEATGLIVLFFVLFAAVALRRGMHVKFAKTIVFLGMLTYPLYLLHNIGKVTLLAWIAPSSPIIALSVTVAFSLGLSALVVRAVEPWRKRLVKQLASAYATTRARLPAAAYSVKSHDSRTQ